MCHIIAQVVECREKRDLNLLLNATQQPVYYIITVTLRGYEYLFVTEGFTFSGSKAAQTRGTASFSKCDLFGTSDDQTCTLWLAVVNHYRPIVQAD